MSDTKIEKTASVKTVSPTSNKLPGIEEPMFKSGSTSENLRMEKTAAMEKLATGVQQNQPMSYPSPFLSLSDTKIPDKMSELFDLCKYFYTFDSIVHGAIQNLATFPVTDVYLEESEDYEKQGLEEESENLKVYKKIFFKTLNIHKLLIEIGIDYWLFGNCFVFGEMWTNPKTKEKEWKHVIRLDPSKIVIDKNDATQEIKYKWHVPERIARIVKSKSPIAEYKKIPELIRKAVEKNETVVLNPNNIYHFSRPTDSMGGSTWGTPIVANVLKLLMYKNILRQSQEAIAREHIVPFRIYYFENTPDTSTSGNYENAATAFRNELMKSTRDPNYKVISSVPVNVLNLGGNGRALLLAPEIEQVQAEILAGMSVPREFVFGGISYSGASIALKILENQFITYRLLLKDFLRNFLIRGMAKVRGEWRDETDDDKLVSIDMVELKMQDDVQQKQLIVNLNGNGKVTDELMWKSIGVDPDKMRTALKSEMRNKLELDAAMKLVQVKLDTTIQKAQMESQLELRKFEIELQKRLESDSDPASQELNQQMQQEKAQEQGQQQGQEQPQQEDQQQGEEQPAQEEQGQPEQQEQQQQEQGQQGQQIDQAQLKDVAKQISKMSEPEQEQALSKLPPEIASLVVKQIKAIANSDANGSFGRGYAEADSIAREIAALPEDQQEQVLAGIPNEGLKSKVSQMLAHIRMDKEDDEKEKDQADGEGIDMRPLPTQRPPRRDSLG